jgi:photosystem II stability/assembly factor-like uncharacterized protein
MQTRRFLSCLLVASAVVLSACSDDAPVESDAPAPASDAGPGHIHGLGVDPADQTLYVATHHGLFAAAEDSTEMRLVGASTQDIMGFSVVDRDRFIGSGHPAPGQNLPPLLGLIESRDGGRTWQNISLLGEADFHVLQSAGARVYGFDSSRGRFMVSDDGGRRWNHRTPPAGVFDVAIDPRTPDRIVASTEGGLFASLDAGRRWRPLARDLAGLLAWPEIGRLYLVDGQGQVMRSADGGRHFEVIGGLGGQPVAFASGGSDLYGALVDGTVKRSSDGGQTWSVRAKPAGSA